MTRIFTGDYSTGDFSQWRDMANRAIASGSGNNLGYKQPTTGNYAAQIISEDLDCGYVARYELRDGDRAYWDVPDVERSETFADNAGSAAIGTTRWYAMSVKFDEGFPTNHSTLGSGIITQFHDYPNSIASPVVALGWLRNDFAGPGFRDNYWYLRHVPRVDVDIVEGYYPVFEFPFNLGEWHDIKMQIKWAQDETGFIRLWWNGVQQTLLGGSTTYFGQTVTPAGGIGQEVTGVTVQQGYYRSHMTQAGIVYHTGYRMADSEDSL